jgi:hypothetical protein
VTETIKGYADYQNRLRAISTAPSAILRELGDAAIRESKFFAPRKTSNLSRSIRIYSESATVIQIIASADYAAAQEFGSRPHIIRPKTPGGILAFAWTKMGGRTRLTGSPRKGSSMVFFRFVKHPGNPATHFLERGIQRAIEKAGLANLIIVRWNNAA